MFTAEASSAAQEPRSVSDNSDARGGPARRRVIQEFLIVVLVLTTLLGGGMLLSDMKGFNFKLPNLEMLKRLLPQRVDDDYDDSPSGFATYADIPERIPVHHDLLPSERAPAALMAGAPPGPSPVRTVRIEAEADQELPPGTYDSHQPNLNRADLEEPDPEIDAVVASLAEDEPPAVEAAPEEQPEPAADDDMNDLMSFFSDAAEVSKIPTTLTENLQHVSASELLAEVQELRALLQGRRDVA
jgi:hypothetical protein